MKRGNIDLLGFAINQRIIKDIATIFRRLACIFSLIFTGNFLTTRQKPKKIDHFPLLSASPDPQISFY